MPVKIFVVCTDGVFTQCCSKFVDGLNVISQDVLPPLPVTACLVQLFSCSILRSRSLHPWQL